MPFLNLSIHMYPFQKNLDNSIFIIADEIRDEDIRRTIEGFVSEKGIALDKRLVYYLLGATGLCVVPLSSFNTDLLGVRFTLLEPDEPHFVKTVETLAMGIETYIDSAVSYTCTVMPNNGDQGSLNTTAQRARL